MDSLVKTSKTVLAIAMMSALFACGQEGGQGGESGGTGASSGSTAGSTGSSSADGTGNPALDGILNGGGSDTSGAAGSASADSGTAGETSDADPKQY